MSGSKDDIQQVLRNVSMGILEKINHFLRYHQPVIHTFGLVTAVGVQLAQAFQLPLPATTANAITFSILAYIVKDISDNTYILKQSKSYTNQEEMYADMIQEIREIRNIREATLIQYSSRKVSPLVFTLLNKGATVNLYVKNPDTEISKMQKGRIERTIQDLPGELSNTLGVLKVYKYDPPASVRGVIIDNRLLAIGWYTYEYVPTSEKDLTYPDDAFFVSGHDVPGMLLHEGSIEFEIFKDLFLKQVTNFGKDVNGNFKKPALHLKKGKIINNVN
jgi:hypothetical protein